MTAILSVTSVASTPGSLSAAEWIEHLLLGPLGTSLAVIAVAWFGFETLTRHLSLRRGATLILGCFILFGAPRIASSLTAMASAAGNRAPGAIAQPIPPPQPAPGIPQPFDPYAGASVPNGQN